MKHLSKELLKIAEDIRTMKIRGASRIGRAAAECLRLASKNSKARTVDQFTTEIERAARILINTRPTAVSLPNSVRFVIHRMREAKKNTSSVQTVRDETVRACNDFVQNSRMAARQIAEIGSNRINEGDVLMTHCQSSVVSLLIKTAQSRGKRIKVFVTETRPRFQGRITAKDLSEAGVPVTIITDSAARHFMSKVDKVIVGADAVAANGALVNKIGTSMIALAAHESRIPFLVAAESYKFSPETMLGELVEIEERDASELIPLAKLRKMKNARVSNPAFDVTPPEYIDLFITERGIIPPQGALLLIQQVFGVISPEELKEFRSHGVTSE
ncbi:MAG: ribose 1,5-bisphosphate isomerase [archaeon]